MEQPSKVVVRYIPLSHLIKGETAPVTHSQRQLFGHNLEELLKDSSEGHYLVFSDNSLGMIEGEKKQVYALKRGKKFYASTDSWDSMLKMRIPDKEAFSLLKLSLEEQQRLADFYKQLGERGLEVKISAHWDSQRTDWQFWNEKPEGHSTFHNGQRMFRDQPVPLASGDLLVIGNSLVAQYVVKTKERVVQEPTSVIELRPTESIDIQAMLDQGKALRDAGRLDEALASCKEVLDRDNENPHAHYFMGTILFQKGDYGEARWHLNRILQTHPGHTSAHERLGIHPAVAGMIPSLPLSSPRREDEQKATTLKERVDALIGHDHHFPITIDGKKYTHLQLLGSGAVAQGLEALSPEKEWVVIKQRMAYDPDYSLGGEAGLMGLLAEAIRDKAMAWEVTVLKDLAAAYQTRHIPLPPGIDERNHRSYFPKLMSHDKNHLVLSYADEDPALKEKDMEYSIIKTLLLQKVRKLPSKEQQLSTLLQATHAVALAHQAGYVCHDVRFEEADTRIEVRPDGSIQLHMFDWNCAYSLKHLESMDFPDAKLGLQKHIFEKGQRRDVLRLALLWSEYFTEDRRYGYRFSPLGGTYDGLATKAGASYYLPLFDPATVQNIPIPIQDLLVRAFIHPEELAATDVCRRAYALADRTSEQYQPLSVDGPFLENKGILRRLLEFEFQGDIRALRQWQKAGFADAQVHQQSGQNFFKMEDRLRTYYAAIASDHSLEFQEIRTIGNAFLHYAKQDS